MTNGDLSDGDVIEGSRRTPLLVRLRTLGSRRRAVVLLTVAGLTVGAAGASLALVLEGGHSPRPRTEAATVPASPTASQTTAAASASAPPSPGLVPPPDPTADLGGGYGRDERFCSQSPIRGDVDYVVAGQNASLLVRLAGLPPSTDVDVDWTNSPVRGYNVGYFVTDAHGRTIPGTTRFFRAGEVRGTSLLLGSDDGSVFATLTPCR